ncbi:MAG: tetratricopeptide repeat protein [Gemmataceae bacterium]|nr:tetratricopeptide repeat protein [Gemmataceae bacterium]
MNVRFVAWLLLGVALFGGGLHLVRGYQVSRNAAAFLRLADDAQARGNLDRTVRYLTLYLAQNPSDTDALARYGEILAKQATTPEARLRAFLTLEQVLRRSPGRHEVRKSLIRQAMHLQRFADAKVHLKTLLDTFPKDGKLELQLGHCEEASGAYAAAGTHYQNTLKIAPGELDAYTSLAELQRRRLKKPRDAKQTMDDLVEKNRGNPKALLARARYLRVHGAHDHDPDAHDRMLVQAAADLDKARKLADKDADVLLESAELALVRGNLDDARKTLQHGLTLHPREVRFYTATSRLEVKAERLPDAVACVRRGLEKLPEERELLWALAHLAIQGGELDEAEKIEGRLRKGGFPTPLLDCLHARVLLQKGAWLEASRSLEKARTLLAPWPDATLQTDLMLGRCYGQLGDSAQQVTAFRRAVALDPLSEPGCIGLGNALAAQGNFDKAFQAYQAVVARSGPARFLAARAMILRTLSQPPAQRSWLQAEQFLDSVTRASPETPELTILRAEILVGKDLLPRAQEELAAATAKQPDRAELWGARAGLLQRQKKWSEALALLDQAGKKVGDHVELRLARARLWTERGGDEAYPALRQLTRQAGTAPEKEWPRLVLALADSWLRLGYPKEARELYGKLARREPNNLGVRLVLFDLALRGNSEQQAQTVLEQIRRIEGEEGTLWPFGKACLLIERARASKTKPAEEVLSLLTAAATRRASWTRLTLAEAEFHELSGRAETALRKYQQAIEAGEQDPVVLYRAVRLLHQRRRFVEADELLAKLRPQPGLALAGLDRISAELHLFKKDPSRALEFARKAVPSDSKDPRELLWLGHVLCASDKWADAEPVFRRAVAVGEKSPDTWITLVQYLVRTGRKDQARTVLTEIPRKLPAEQVPLALAQCHESLGEFDQAWRLYQEAEKARRDDLPVLRNLARFSLRVAQLPDAKELLRTDRLPDAKHYLQTIVNLQARAPEDAAWARRLLAIVLVAGGDYQQSRDALAVLGILDESQLRELTGGQTGEDLRARAVVLAAQNTHSSRQKAIPLVEELVRKERSPADQFLLAQLYEAVGNHRGAQLEIESLLAAKPNDPGYLAFHVQILLGRKALDEAEQSLTRLEKAQPDTYRTLRLKARLLHARGKAKDAVKFLEDLAERKPTQLGPVAVLLEEIGQHQAAERAFRRFAAQPKQPRNVLLLATFLGRRDRLDEALQLCAGAWKTCPPEDVVDASLEALYSAKATPAHCSEVATRLEEARRRWPREAHFVSALAAVRRLEGRYPEAVDLYHKTVRLDPRDALARNNLAWLLALKEEGKGEEALGLIEEAIKIAGPRGPLLDTRGVIHLTLGQVRPAIDDLKQAVAEAPTPGRLFHLAQAYLRAGQRRDAGDAWQRARNAGLAQASLDPLELSAYQQLQSVLDKSDKR